jgi:hypothetical protein
MLFEEWEEGTDLHDYDEYKLAEQLYNVMPNNFDKNKLYKLRLAMTKDHFSFLCSLASMNSARETYLRERNDKLAEKDRFVTDMIDTLNKEMSVDLIHKYILLKGNDALNAKVNELEKKWEELNG